MSDNKRCPKCGKESLHEIRDMFDENKVHYLCDSGFNNKNNKYFINTVSNDNPCRDIPYWGRGDGRNLSAIHALEWAEAYLEEMQKFLPCEENVASLCHIKLAIKAQRDRIELRRKQGVLGTSKPHTSAQGLPDIA